MIRPFVRFTRDGDDVVVKLDTMLSVERREFHLRIGTASQIAAELLADHLTDTRERLVRELVDQAYRDGYRDGRAKRAKRAYHDTFLGTRAP